MKHIFIAALLMQSVLDVRAQQTVGLFTETTGSQDGYVLFSPITSNNTYLIDKCGKEVHSWTGTYKPGQSVYLLADGSLLRPGNAGNSNFNAGGSGGIIQRIDWFGNVAWSYSLSDDTECQHHDVCYLPNGNILAICWESRTTAQAIAAGRSPALLGSVLWTEKIIELHPSGSNAATVVWEWHLWDHLVQDYDNTKLNYGAIAQHPELVNLNFTSGQATNSDWIHMNGIDYNAQLDQVMVSAHNLNEIWVIDHSTTTAAAATHTGGAHNKGGDLLYRWGNPAAYGAGVAADQKLYGQHNPHWVAGGLQDSGKIMIFNNGQGRPGGNSSSVDVVTPPVDNAGSYALVAGQAYAPAAASWSYQAATPSDFYASNISGAQRLPNGNTIICSGPSGKFFEIDESKNIVWEYVNPVTNIGPVSQGTAPSQNAVFRSPLYLSSYPGFVGHTLTAGSPIELNPLAYTCPVNTDVDALDAIGDITVVNPFGNIIGIRSAVEMKDVYIRLTSLMGSVYLQREHVALGAGMPVSLDIQNSLPAGMYILSINSSIYSKNIRVVHL